MHCAEKRWKDNGDRARNYKLHEKTLKLASNFWSIHVTPCSCGVTFTSPFALTVRINPIRVACIIIINSSIVSTICSMVNGEQKNPSLGSRMLWAVLVFIINVTYGTNGVAHIKWVAKVHIGPESCRRSMQTHRNTKFNTKNGSTFVCIVAHSIEQLLLLGEKKSPLLSSLSLYEFNNYCNILSPEEFNRRAVSFAACGTRIPAPTHTHTHI